MTGIVVDASVALEGRTVIFPAVWALEISNAMLVAERRKRVKQQDVRRFVELLGGLTIIEHSQTAADTVSHVLPLAREYNLSAYDAAYLDVAVRQGAPLATLDRALRKAGRSAGLKIFKA